MRPYRKFPITIILLLALAPPIMASDQPAGRVPKPGNAAVVQKPAPAAARSPRVFVHYMPWFMARPYSQIWGWHWTMNTFDPEGRNGSRATLASHYHPIIGPYDSGDPDVLEYHALLMKLAGVDGVIIDWYGTVDFLDYGFNQRNCKRFVDQAVKTGLEFAVCYEDQTIPNLVRAGRLKAGSRVSHARSEIAWLREHWFSQPSYLRINGQPVLLSFGQDGLSDSEWETITGERPVTFSYLSEHRRRKAAAGAFDWPSPRAGKKAQEEFAKQAAQWPVAMAVAYPRFHDIYEEAKVHPSWGKIDDDDGKTFEVTLEKALRGGLPLVQICTWNDWGEGTMIEPSTEFGHRDLEVIQRLRRQIIQPGFENNPDDLRVPHRLFKLRKAANGNQILNQKLDQMVHLISKGSNKAARESLGSLEEEEHQPR
jgi:hypothetical protein